MFFPFTKTKSEYKFTVRASLKINLFLERCVCLREIHLVSSETHLISRERHPVSLSMRLFSCVKRHISFSRVAHRLVSRGYILFLKKRACSQNYWSNLLQFWNRLRVNVQRFLDPSKVNNLVLKHTVLQKKNNWIFIGFPDWLHVYLHLMDGRVLLFTHTSIRPSNTGNICVHLVSQ